MYCMHSQIPRSCSNKRCLLSLLYSYDFETLCSPGYLNSYSISEALNEGNKRNNNFLVFVAVPNITQGPVSPLCQWKELLLMQAGSPMPQNCHLPCSPPPPHKTSSSISERSQILRRYSAEDTWDSRGQQEVRKPCDVSTLQFL